MLQILADNIPQDKLYIVQKVLVKFKEDKQAIPINQINQKYRSIFQYRLIIKNPQLKHFNIIVGYQVLDKKIMIVFKTQVSSIDQQIFCTILNQSNIKSKLIDFIYFLNSSQKVFQGKLPLVFQNNYLSIQQIHRNLLIFQRQYQQILQKSLLYQTKTKTESKQKTVDLERKQKNLKKKISQWILIWRDKIIEAIQQEDPETNPFKSKSVTKNISINPKIEQKTDTINKIQKQNQYDKILKACGQKRDPKEIIKKCQNNFKEQKKILETNSQYDQKFYGNIAKVIKIISIEEQKWQSCKLGGYGTLRKLYAHYYVTDSSLYNQSLEINQKNSIKKQGYLIQKSPHIKENLKQNQDSLESFKIQTFIITYMRSFKCHTIAEYYLEGTINNLQKIEKFYLKEYDSSFDQFLENQNSNKEKYVLKVIKNIVGALKFLGHIQICHRDLKPSNIMLDQNYQAKVIDFGSACLTNTITGIKQLSSKCRSTRGYYASSGEINNQNMKRKLIQTSNNPKNYEQMNKKQRQLAFDRAFNRHKNFDIYAFGTILFDSFQGNLGAKSNSTFVNQKIFWLGKICQAVYPLHRPDIFHISIFWKLLSKLWQLNTKLSNN